MFRCLRITNQGMHTPYLHRSNYSDNSASSSKIKIWISSQIGMIEKIQQKIRNTWKVDWITYKLGYILHKSCCPSFMRICCTIKSIATWLSPPRGIMISAYFLVGRIKSSKAGFTNLEYCIKYTRISNYSI